MQDNQEHGKYSINGVRKKLQSFLRRQKREKKFHVLAVLMSLVVTVSVLGSLISPAISATDGGDIGAGAAAYSESTGGTDFGDNIVSASIVPTGDDTGDPNKVNAVIRIEYALQHGFVPVGEYSITYQLPYNVTVPDENNRSGSVSLEGSAYSGTYTISESGLITITFPEGYLDGDDGSEGYRDKPIIGFVELDCDILRDEGSGDTSVEVRFNDTVSGSVSFDAQNVTVSKSGSYNGDGTATWQITVQNPLGRDLAGCVISDTMFADATLVDSSVGTLADGKLTLNSTTEKYVTVEYITPLQFSQVEMLKGKSINNTAFITPPDGSDIDVISDPVTGSLWVKPSITVSKSGDPVYTDSGATITWTINVSVSDEYDASALNGLKLEDSAFAAAAGITVSGAALEQTGNTLTVRDAASKEITVTYTTEASSDADYNNTVYAKPVEDEWNYAEASAHVEKQFYVTKYGSVNMGRGTVTWTVVVTNNDTSSDFSFNGYKLDDAMLGSAVEGSVAVSPSGSVSKDGTLSGITEGTSAVTVTYETPSGVDFASAVSTKVSNKADLIGINGMILDTANADVWYQPRRERTKSAGNAQTSEDRSSVTVPWTVEYKLESGDFKQHNVITDSWTSVIKSGYDGEAPAASAVAGSFKVYYETNADNQWHELDVSGYELSIADSSFTVTLKGTDAVVLDVISGVRISYDTQMDISQLSGLENNVVIGIENTAKVDDNYPAAGTLEYTVQNEAPYKKYILNKDGQLQDGQTPLSTSELEKIDIDGIQYYLFKWAIVANESGRYAGSFTLTDTLPEGMSHYEGGTLNVTVSGESRTLEKPAATCVSPGYGYSWVTDKNNASYTMNYTYDPANGSLAFNLSGIEANTTVTVYYDTIIECEILKDLIAQKEAAGESYSVVNTVQDLQNNEEPVSLSQTVAKDPNEGFISKTAGPSNEGKVTYTLDINPDAKDMALGDWLTVNDVLKTDGADKGAVNASLQSITVKDADTGAALSAGEFSYTYNNTPKSYKLDIAMAQTASQSFAETNNYRSTVTYQFAQPLDAGAKHTFVVTGGIPGTELCYKLYNTGEYDGTATQEQKLTFDENGSAVISFTPDSGQKLNYLFLYAYSDVNLQVTSAYKTLHDYTAKISLKVPDSKHLIVEYTYFVYKSGQEEKQVEVLNVASVSSEDPISSADYRHSIILANKSSAAATSTPYMKLRKVSASNLNLELDAGFKLLRYNAETGIWQAAASFKKHYLGDVDTGAMEVAGWADTDISSGLTDEQLMMAVSSLGVGEEFATNNGAYNIHLDDNTVYMLVETRVPDGYVGANAPFYFCYNGYDDLEALALAAGIDVDSITFILQASEYLFENVKAVDVSTEKSWSAASGDSGAYATFKLVRSHTKLESGIPEDAEDVPAEVIPGQEQTVKLGSTFGWTHTWQRLPETDDSGREWFYYAEEVSYFIGGIEYKVSEESTYKPEYAMTKDENGETVVVKNISDEQPSEPVMLPKTGGKGALGICAAGFSLVLIALACLYISKVRRRM